MIRSIIKPVSKGNKKKTYSIIKKVEFDKKSGGHGGITKRTSTPPPKRGCGCK